MYLISSVLKWDQIGVKTGYFELEEKKLSKRHPTAPNLYSDVSCWQPYKVNSVETYCDTISDSQKNSKWSVRLELNRNSAFEGFKINSENISRQKYLEKYSTETMKS